MANVYRPEMKRFKAYSKYRNRVILGIRQVNRKVPPNAATPDDASPRLRAFIELHEGRRSRLYLDTKGIPTIGIGRNLRHRGLADDEIEYLFENDLKIAINTARDFCSIFDSLSTARQAVLIDMAFNMGQRSLYYFKRFQAALNAKEFAKAAEEMARSKWATDVPERARVLIWMMKNNMWPEELRLRD